MEPKSEIYKAAIISSVILLLGTGLFFWRAGFFSKTSCRQENLNLCNTESLCVKQNLYWWGNACHPEAEPVVEPSQYPDFDYFKQISDKTKFVLVSNHESYAPLENPSSIVGRFTKTIKTDGVIEDGYLYVRASVDNNEDKTGGKPLKTFDSIFANLNYFNSQNQ